MVTNQQRREQIITDRLLKGYEKAYAKKIKTIRNEIISKSSLLYEETGVVYTPELLDEYNQKLVAAYRANSRAVVPTFSKRVVKQLRQQITDIERFDNVGYHTLLSDAWVSEFALEKSKLVSS